MANNVFMVVYGIFICMVKTEICMSKKAERWIQKNRLTKFEGKNQTK
jgi:hypothetical protein